MVIKFSKERLEKSRDLFLIPRVDIGISSALNNISIGNMTEFVQGVAVIDSLVEHHIFTNCTKAESDEIRRGCITDAYNIRTRAINRLSEGLVDKCGGELRPIEEEK